MINTHHWYKFTQFVTTLSHFCRLKLYCTYCINGYISKITISKLTVNGQLPGDAPHPSHHINHTCAPVHTTPPRDRKLGCNLHIHWRFLGYWNYWYFRDCVVKSYNIKYWISVKWKYHEISVRFWKYQYIH